MSSKLRGHSEQETDWLSIGFDRAINADLYCYLAYALVDKWDSDVFWDDCLTLGHR